MRGSAALDSRTRAVFRCTVSSVHCTICFRSRGGIDLRQLELLHGPRWGALVRYYISCWSNVTVLGGRYAVFVHALASRSSGGQFSELDGRTAHHFYAPERTYRDVKPDSPPLGVSQRTERRGGETRFECSFAQNACQDMQNSYVIPHISRKLSTSSASLGGHLHTLVQTVELREAEERLKRPRMSVHRPADDWASCRSRAPRASMIES